MVLSDAAAFVAHNAIENDHELWSAELRRADGFGLPKFLRDTAQLLTVCIVGAQR
jgi:hypothetical protein